MAATLGATTDLAPRLSSILAKVTGLVRAVRVVLGEFGSFVLVDDQRIGGEQAVTHDTHRPGRPGELQAAGQ